MDIFSSLVDIHMSYEGDLNFENGDLKLVNGLDLVKRKVFKIITTEPSEWKLYPAEGGSPVKFIGEPNTRDIGQQIQSYLVEKISPHVIPATVSARVVPISYDSVKCYLELDILGLKVTEIPFTMDLVNGIINTDVDEGVDTIVASDDLKFNDSESLTNPNPFADRLRRQ
tara:strand:+ start:89 stop:598 length:510 start_codon:yes stop_codon:yes gene_type:complete